MRLRSIPGSKKGTTATTTRRRDRRRERAALENAARSPCPEFRRVYGTPYSSARRDWDLQATIYDKRRDALPAISREYDRLRTDRVDVRGTGQDEDFRIERDVNGAVEMGASALAPRSVDGSATLAVPLVDLAGFRRVSAANESDRSAAYQLDATPARRGGTLPPRPASLTIAAGRKGRRRRNPRSRAAVLRSTPAGRDELSPAPARKENGESSAASLCASSVSRDASPSSNARLTASSRTGNDLRNSVRRSTVGILKRFASESLLRDVPVLLVPRGGIEPPTRGFSVPSSPSRSASSPLGTSVEHVARPVKAGTPKHGHARSLSRGSIVFGPDVLLAVDHDRRAIRGRGDRYAAVDASTRRLRGVLWARRVLAVRACRWSRF